MRKHKDKEIVSGAESKKEIRRRILDCRNRLSSEERIRGKILLTERILGHQWFYRSEIILGFINYGSEISTEEILQTALNRGKSVYLPKVSGDCRMHFYQVKALEELRQGYRGIREPSGETKEYLYQEEDIAKTMMLMPGVAFDVYRNRIGYGKGFYDRYLADKPQLQCKTIAVGYKCQLVDRIIEEERDIKPYQVICV